MKQSVTKILSVVLCALLALGGIGGTVYAMSASNGAEPANDESPADSGAEHSAPKTSSYDPDAERNSKDETVYVLASADGSVQKIIVSGWVRNTLGSDTIQDVSQLSDIETVKGNETFTLGGNNACVWDAKGNDIYYQGNLNKELPVTMSVSYTLDGQAISPDALAGKSGKVVIRFDYTNHESETVTVNGQQETIYVPFAMLTGLLLDNDVFRNVEVSNGKLMNDGDRTVVAGLAFPGLQDSLGLDRDKLELPDYVEITADVTNFSLETTVTLAANGLFNEAMEEADRSEDGLDGLNGLDEDLNKLTDAMEQLMDGSSRLYDGLCTLLDSSGELVDGIGQLAAGAERLKNGAADLNDGAVKLQTGAAALSKGLNTLAANNDTLNAGAAQVFNTLLSTAATQLKAAGLDVPTMTIDNYSNVLNGVIKSLDKNAVYETALAQVTAAVEKQRPYIQSQVTDAVRQAVATGVTAAVEEQVTEQVTQTVRAQVTEQVVQTAAHMDLDSYQKAVAAGQVDDATQTAVNQAVDRQMASEAIQQTIAKNGKEQMESEPVKDLINQNVEAQMGTDDIKKQIADNTEAQVQKAISDNMAGETVQAQLKAASEGAQSVIALKASLDSYNTFYLGLQNYTAGVAQSAAGAVELNQGLITLKNGTASLSDGAAQLYSGVLTLKNGAPALIDGVTQLRDGAMELSDGLKDFNEQGVQKLTDAFDGDLSGLMDRLDAVRGVSERYNSFSGIHDNMDGQVKFIWRTEAVEHEE